MMCLEYSVSLVNRLDQMATFPLCGAGSADAKKNPNGILLTSHSDEGDAMTRTHNRPFFFLRLATLTAAVLVARAAIPAVNSPSTVNNADRQFTHDTYSEDEVAKAASDFFSTGAKELSDVLAKVLKEKGRPVAIIRGEEAGGALGVGLRYGRGELVFKGVPARKIYWQGPSIGFDVGANAVKAFILVYDLPNAA